MALRSTGTAERVISWKNWRLRASSSEPCRRGSTASSRQPIPSFLRVESCAAATCASINIRFQRSKSRSFELGLGPHIGGAEVGFPAQTVVGKGIRSKLWPSLES